MQTNNPFLWISVVVLLLAMTLWGRRYQDSARARAERARRAAERQELGGDSYFLPPPPIEQAVELSSPVEIDSLLDGEPEAIAALARRQLEETTEVGSDGGLREMSFGLGRTPPPPPTLHQRIAQGLDPDTVVPLAPEGTGATGAGQGGAAAGRPISATPTITAPITAPVTPRITPPMTPPGTPPAAPGARAPAPAPLPASAAPAPPPPPTEPGGEELRIPVRELVLAWFEARGYRATLAGAEARPIELVLRHRKTPERVYAFVVERARVGGPRITALLSQARAAGVTRLLVAAEAGFEPGMAQQVRPAGIRLFDDSGIRDELRKIDLRVAAKIIAVAHRRANARRQAPVPATLAERGAAPRDLETARS